jgi:hypothetical protein
MAGATIVIAVGYGMVAATLPVLTLRASSPGSFSRAFGFVFTGWGTARLLAPRECFPCFLNHRIVALRPVKLLRQMPT